MKEAKSRYNFKSLQNSKFRCVYCHEDLNQEARYQCPDCSSMAHAECAKELGVCTTIGCETSYPGITMTKPSCDHCYRDQQMTVDLIILGSCETCQRPTFTSCPNCLVETRSYCRHMFNGRTCDMCEAQTLRTTSTCEHCNAVTEETCFRCYCELINPHQCTQRPSILSYFWDKLNLLALYLIEPGLLKTKKEKPSKKND